ncbi:unnamed protein product [Vicia faba]|uniref:Uncharacterized protein n=1 Tax=Vicia faba TaxID=3906 RepID=A0AAV1AT99_VICFA|nr:unnamed protein product [Vicia faba]
MIEQHLVDELESDKGPADLMLRFVSREEGKGKSGARNIHELFLVLRSEEILKGDELAEREGAVTDHMSCNFLSRPCFGKKIKCPTQCPLKSPSDPNAKVCSLDCASPVCSTANQTALVVDQHA